MIRTETNVTMARWGLQHILLVILLCLSLMSGVAQANDEQIKIAVVNVPFLMKNAPEAELASLALKAEFEPREQALKSEQERIQQLEAERDNNRGNWSEEQVRQADRQIRSLERERARDLEDFREELRFARDSALDDVQKSVFQAIEEVRVQRNIDIVIQDYFAASQRVDITPVVLTYLQEQLEKQQSETTDTADDAEK